MLFLPALSVTKTAVIGWTRRSLLLHLCLQHKEWPTTAVHVIVYIGRWTDTVR